MLSVKKNPVADHVGAAAADSPPLVMIHGFLCAGEFFQPVINSLSRRRNIGNTGDIITLDLPGFGDSNDQLAANTISDMAACAQQTLAAHNIRRYHLLGHSMGGMVALQCALTQPAALQSLILYATNSSGDLPERFETFAQSKRRLRARFAAGKREICATWLTDGARHPHFNLLQRCADKVSLDTAQKAIDAMAAFNVDARLSQLSMPALIISAEHDRTYSLARQQRLRENIPGAKQRIIKNCAHCAHLEDEAGFTDIMQEWLAG